jgi:copper chaperone CopZ
VSANVAFHESFGHDRKKKEATMPVIKISGMSCAHCTGSVTKILQATPGISNISVTLDPGQASFDAAPEVNLDQVKDAIRKIGFDPQD